MLNSTPQDHTANEAAPTAAGPSTASRPAPWFKSDVIYQIYPKSFCDFDGDGLGDLKGIDSKIDYLRGLGIGAVWFSPFYPSPQADNGYDISNYVDIDPRFGTLADFDCLVARLHASGIKVIVDVVFNHSSDQHPWFQAALSSEDSPYRDYYIWRDGRDGRDGRDWRDAEAGRDADAGAETGTGAGLGAEAGPALGTDTAGTGGSSTSGLQRTPPNNWTAFFGGPSWSQRGVGEQFYLHTFTPEQPDLNWENPAVRDEIARIMDFWLDRGVDGFRMDVINLISKHPEFPDGDLAGPNPDTIGIEHYGFGPRLIEFLTELRSRVVDPRNSANEALPPHEQRAAIALIGETPGMWPDLARVLVQDDGGPLDMIFHFEHMGIDQGPGGKFDLTGFRLTDLKNVLARWHSSYAMDAWNSQYFGNHDQPRVVSRWGDGSPAAAKALAAMLLLQRGTPFVFQGDEIGMTNAGFDSIESYDDIESINRYHERITAGQDPREVLAAIAMMGRDNARTPVRWTGSTEAGHGFTAGEPWLGFGTMPPGTSVAEQESDPDSVLNFYRSLITLRRENAVFVDGTADFLAVEDPQIWALERQLPDDSARSLVLVNFSPSPAQVPDVVEAKWPIFDVVMGTHRGADRGLGDRGPAGAGGSGRAGVKPHVLEPYEVIIAVRT